MNKVLRYEVPEEIPLDASTAAVLTRHLHNSNATVFEVYDSFLLISFEWFNLKSKSKREKRFHCFSIGSSFSFLWKMLILCTQYRSLFETEKEKSCQEMLRMFFIQLIEHDMEYIDEFEEMITNAEDHALQEKRKDYLNQIIKFRKSFASEALLQSASGYFLTDYWKTKTDFSTKRHCAGSISFIIESTGCSSV